MIIVMEHRADREKVDAVISEVERAGYQVHVIEGVERTVIGAVGDKSSLARENINLEVLPGVEKVVPIMQPYKLASRAFNIKGTVIKVGDIEIGGDTLQIAAGPCAVESYEQLLEIAEIVKNAGATILRGGAFKPRSSPYSFQGLEEQALKYLAEARERTGLLIVTEVLDARDLPMLTEYADILQIGARNMQNFSLLREVAKVDCPVLLKRGLSSSIEEWLLAAEYLMAGGNYRVILCERGIRSFDNYTRNVLDLTAVPVLKHLTHLPVIVDPSHAIGKWRFVPTMAKSAVTAGADGLLIEVHPNPPEALCDGPQSLNPAHFNQLMVELKRVAAAVDKKMA